MGTEWNEWVLSRRHNRESFRAPTLNPYIGVVATRYTGDGSLFGMNECFFTDDNITVGSYTRIEFWYVSCPRYRIDHSPFLPAVQSAKTT